MLERSVPKASWTPVLGGALLALVLTAAYIELRLGLRGFRASAADSAAMWAEQRDRASALGKDALILVGASRMQLDVDTALLSKLTGRPVVQLAIDGSNFRPIFEGLAADPRITGTVLVDAPALHMVTLDADTGSEWQAAWDRRKNARLPDFNSVEANLAGALRSRLRAYADGARPLDSIEARLLPAQPTRQYLVTSPDRSRAADYARVDMPWFYFARAARNFGVTLDLKPGVTAAEVDAEIRRQISEAEPHRGMLPVFEKSAAEVAEGSRAIRARGGQVVFLSLPVSGLVREADERRFPRPEFWDRFAAAVGPPTLHYADVPAMAALQCPDGSHLDMRQRAAFTQALVAATGLADAPP